MGNSSCLDVYASGIVYTAMEYRNAIFERHPVKAVLFDFDGTISTLRHGWEEIMGSFMAEILAGTGQADEALAREIQAYINESAGIQTIYQMQWLEQEVRRRGLSSNLHDAWWYKAEYNLRLLNMVKARVRDLQNQTRKPEDFLIKGVREFIEYLHSRGVSLYLASGTDHEDVVRELTVLGLQGYFTEVVGAPEGKIACSKEMVLRLLLETRGLRGEELMVIGDGKVEIALGREVGALTLGVASDESKREGINPAKLHRLISAGAHMVVGDFLCYRELISIL